MCGGQQRAAVPHETCCVTNGFCSSWLPSICLYCLCENHKPLPMQEAYFGGQTFELSTASITTSLSFLLDGPWRTCPAHRAPTSHEKEGACLMGNGPHSFLGPWAYLCQQPLSTSPCLWKDFMRTQAHAEMCLLPHDGNSNSKVHQRRARIYHQAVSPVCFQIS